jgi:hypothetical protein
MQNPLVAMPGQHLKLEFEVELARDSLPAKSLDNRTTLRLVGRIQLQVARRRAGLFLGSRGRRQKTKRGNGKTASETKEHGSKA